MQYKVGVCVDAWLPLVIEAANAKEAVRLVRENQLFIELVTPDRREVIGRIMLTSEVKPLLTLEVDSVELAAPPKPRKYHERRLVES